MKALSFGGHGYNHGIPRENGLKRQSNKGFKWGREREREREKKKKKKTVLKN